MHIIIDMLRCQPRYKFCVRAHQKRRRQVVKPRVELSWSKPEVEVDPEATEGLVAVGRVTLTHGVKGELKVLPLTDEPQLRLGTPGKRWLVPRNRYINTQQAQIKEVELLYGKEVSFKGTPSWIVKLKGVDSLEEAELIRNYYLMINQSDRQPLDDQDTFYLQDLIGLKVKLKDTSNKERIIGQVVDILKNTGTYDVIRVQFESEPTRSFLIPFQKSMVPQISLEEKYMLINPPDGLLDVYKGQGSAKKS